jgi:hypothetical protein
MSGERAGNCTTSLRAISKTSGVSVVTERWQARHSKTSTSGSLLRRGILRVKRIVMAQLGHGHSVLSLAALTIPHPVTTVSARSYRAVKPGNKWCALKVGC